MNSQEFDYWSKFSDLIVMKSDFDESIYTTVYSRNKEDTKYFSSQQLSVRLNNNKVIVLSKRGIIIHRNFKMMSEVI